VRLGSEAVTSAKRSLTGRGAQLGVLDRTATEADEVVVMLRAAADVRGAPVTGQGVQRAGSTEEIERPIGSGQTEPG
jgi:hypothetical protein